MLSICSTKEMTLMVRMFSVEADKAARYQDMPFVIGASARATIESAGIRITTLRSLDSKRAYTSHSASKWRMHYPESPPEAGSEPT
jgi:hypothetical protein